MFSANKVTENESMLLQESSPQKKGATYPPFWVPFLVLIIASLVIRFGGFDLGVERLFWNQNQWPLGENGWIKFCYHHGTKPAIIAAVAGAAYWLICTIRRRDTLGKSLGAFLALLMLIGPGLLVNVLFKGHFGRPRPNEVREFGGEKAFQALGDPNLKVSGKSFPSGHASMGFFWLGLFVFLWNRHRKWAWFFCGLGLAHGLTMGMGRMMQGSHWPSDVLWSAGFVYFTAWVLCRWFFTEKQKALCDATPAVTQKP